MHCLPQFDKHLAWPSTATQKQFILRITLYVLRIVCFFLPFVTVGSDIIHATQPETPPLPTPLAGLADSANIFWRDESRVSNEALLSNDIMLPKIAH